MQGSDGAVSLRRDTARTRDMLLDTVGTLLAEKGVGFSLPDLARASGVATATVYRHFADVQDAHRDFYYRLIDELVTELAAVPGQGEKRFDAMCVRWARMAVDWGRAATRIRSSDGFLERIADDDPPTTALRSALAPVVGELAADGVLSANDVDFKVLMWITIFDERVVIDLAQQGWSSRKIARSLAAAVLGAWERSDRTEA
ncbi:TetR/AcrR family transcriptional regulator [Rhodococcoides fascians]|uniref:TetR/AcrR family transcriptional regulator n=1 Tax=Rhodococcoides fascians TaxID=1828 RepID=UPI00050CB732|nr:TetR/AcrR family transcriptional regulator [Rhodococcus fascians]